VAEACPIFTPSSMFHSSLDQWLHPGWILQCSSYLSISQQYGIYIILTCILAIGVYQSQIRIRFGGFTP
jgi:hypothetical protein